MPPIPVHLDDPIVPQKPQGATPQTSEASRDPAVSLPANTTQSASSAYPPARPGAAAVPAPTGYVPQPAPQPTRTQPQAVQNAPPPPQPGAVPVPPHQQAYAHPTSTLPPPPKAGETLQHHQTTTMPAQMHIPPPAQNYAPTHSTASYIPPTATSQSGGRPTTVNLGPVSHEPQSDHPPGYHQDTQAQEMTAAQRLYPDGHERKGSILDNLGGDAAGETAENVWNTVKNWASVAGEKLAETEESVWKRINGH